MDVADDSITLQRVRLAARSRAAHGLVPRAPGVAARPACG
jgi:hypothetical protein